MEISHKEFILVTVNQEELEKGYRINLRNAKIISVNWNMIKPVLLIEHEVIN